MTPFRPTSYDRPGEQISTTPSGLKVTSAKRLMVDSMVTVSYTHLTLPTKA